MSSAPVTPPQRRNTALWWILGILAVGVIVMFLFGVTIAGLFIHRLSVRDSGRNVEIQTPVGDINVNKAEHSTGLPAYPGATASTDNTGGSVDVTANGSGVGIATEVFDSKDPIDFVQAWYKKRLGPDFHLENGKDASDAHVNNFYKADENDVAFVDDRGNGARIVALKTTSNGTRITLLRVGKREPQ
jgi:hypothetical protein